MAEPIDAQVQELGDFLQRYRERSVHPVLWVGAGASAAAGYPTLGQLEQLLRAQLPGVEQSGFALINAFIARYSEADLILELQRHIAQPRPFVQLHEALARLAGAGVCPLLLTTNYDRLIENALSAAGVAFVSQTLEANFTLQALDTVQVLKLHGDVGDWEHVVLTAASYAEFQRAYPLLQQQLNLHLRTRPVVFVGCSMRDPRLLDWLAGLSVAERRRLFASRVLITAHDWDALPPDTRALLDSANVKAITVPQYDSVTRLLTQVAARLVPPTAQELVFDLTPGEMDWTVVGPLTDSPPHTVPNPLVDADFITLLQELREWSSQPLRLDDPTTPTVRARLDRLARQVGARLTQVLCSPAARAAVARRIHALDQGRARLTLRVAERGLRGDQALALPWELLMPEEDTFAVHAGQLDVVREAVTDGAPPLTAPTAPLTVAVTIAAPEGQAALNYEQEAFRLYAALAPLGHQVAFSDLGTVEDLTYNVTLVCQTKFAHVESRLSSRKRQGGVVFYTLANLCDRRACSAIVAVGSEHHDGPSFDLPVGQGGARVVDLVERIAPRHQLVQRQPALAEPPHEHREVAVGPAGTAGRAAEDLPHEHVTRIDRRWVTVGHAHEHGGTPVLEAVHTGPRRGQHLLGRLAKADGVEHKVGPALRDLQNTRHGILPRRIDADAGAELLRERDLLVAEVDHDNRVSPQVVRRLDDAEADAAGADHGHRLPGTHVG